MTHNKLKLNDDKTEALITPARRISNCLPLPDSLTVGNSTVCFSQSAKYLGVTLDMHLTMTAHVVNLIRTNFELRCINSISLCSSHQNSCFGFCSFMTGLLQFNPFRMPPVPAKQTSKGSEQCSPPHLESS